MREVIEEILGTEKEAERLVEEARAKAAELRNAADVEAARILSQAREDAQAALKNDAQKAREKARAAHAEAVRKAEEENERFLARHEPSLGRLVEQVVAVVLTPEHEKR